MPGELLLINPRKRRKARATAPKRAAKRATSRRKKTMQHMTAYHQNPAPRRRRRLSAIKSSVKKVRRYSRNPISKFSISSITGMAKNAAVGAAGALAVDALFGYAKTMLPASMQSPISDSGGVNPMYYLAKGGLAVAVGVLGSKITKEAGNLAAGSLTISTYEIFRSFIPVSIPLGYVNPAQLANRRMRPPQMNKFVSGGPSMSGYTAPVNKPYMGEFVS